MLFLDAKAYQEVAQSVSQEVSQGQYWNYLHIWRVLSRSSKSIILLLVICVSHHLSCLLHLSYLSFHLCILVSHISKIVVTITNRILKVSWACWWACWFCSLPWHNQRATNLRVWRIRYTLYEALLSLYSQIRFP